MSFEATTWMPRIEQIFRLESSLSKAISLGMTFSKLVWKHDNTCRRYSHGVLQIAGSVSNAMQYCGWMRRFRIERAMLTSLTGLAYLLSEYRALEARAQD